MPNQPSENTPSAKRYAVVPKIEGDTLGEESRSLLSQNPQLQNTTVPEKYRGNPEVDRQFYYTIPEKLLRHVVREIGEKSTEFTDLRWQRELELSRITGDHSFLVGFWRDHPIECDLLNRNELTRSNMDASWFESVERMDENLEELNSKLGSFHRIASGYAGWLMTNRLFRTEMRELFTRFADSLYCWGTKFIGFNVPARFPPGEFNPTQDPGWQDFNTSVLEFCARWRLQGFAGPQLPIPARPMMAGQFPLIILEQLMRAGGLFNWPDTFPISSRDELRDLLTNALGQNRSVPHLDEWRDVIASTARSKSQIGVFSRRFKFQHFWRLLRERHPTLFQGNLAKLELAFAEFFDMDEKTIRADRHEIENALGDEWDIARNATPNKT